MVPGPVIRAGRGNVARRQEIMDRREISAHRMRRSVRCERFGWGTQVMSMEASAMGRSSALIGMNAEPERRDTAAVVPQGERR